MRILFLGLIPILIFVVVAATCRLATFCIDRERNPFDDPPWWGIPLWMAVFGGVIVPIAITGFVAILWLSGARGN